MDDHQYSYYSYTPLLLPRRISSLSSPDDPSPSSSDDEQQDVDEIHTNPSNRITTITWMTNVSHHPDVRENDYHKTLDRVADTTNSRIGRQPSDSILLLPATASADERLSQTPPDLLVRQQQDEDDDIRAKVDRCTPPMTCNVL